MVLAGRQWTGVWLAVVLVVVVGGGGWWLVVVGCPDGLHGCAVLSFWWWAILEDRRMNICSWVGGFERVGTGALAWRAVPAGVGVI